MQTHVVLGSRYNNNKKTNFYNYLVPLNIYLFVFPPYGVTMIR